MTRSLLLFLGALALGACSEQGFKQPLPNNDAPRPRPLEGEHHTDRIVQVSNPEVDVLFLVDNSCSMGDKQNKLLTSFPIFMGFFVGSGLDYHVGVISTDMDNNSHRGKLRQAGGVRWIDPDNQYPVQTFSSMAGMGINGSGDERGRDAIWYALNQERDNYNAGFQRDGASLHIVAISDEPDSSRLITIGEFVQFLTTLKTGDRTVTFSSIVNPPGVWDAGTQYIQVSQAIGGIMWDLRRDDWGEVLEQLGLQALGLRREYFLSRLPVVDTLQVAVREDGIRFELDPSEWIYDASRNSIRFLEFLPPPLSEVLVDYDVRASHHGEAG